jgi:enamine deaminase RidA (YjgF/YER057c/UK114 family)
VRLVADHHAALLSRSTVALYTSSRARSSDPAYNAGMIPHHPSDVPEPQGNYVHAMEVPSGSRLLFVSGQIPGDVPATFDDQCRSVWTHVVRTLSAANMQVTDIVKVTTFLTDRAHAGRNGEIRREILGTHAPALTVVVVQTLEPAWLLEIEVVAAS